MSDLPKEPTDTHQFHVRCSYCGHECYFDFRDSALENIAYVQGDWFCDAQCVKLSQRAVKRRTPYPIR